jgi:hypothetical protein
MHMDIPKLYFVFRGVLELAEEDKLEEAVSFETT